MGFSITRRTQHAPRNEFIVPILKTNLHGHLKDIMYWKEWPVRHPSLLFTGLHYEDARYLISGKT